MAAPGEAAEPNPAEAALAAVQAEKVVLETEVASLREDLANLTHEYQLLLRRLYGNKTEHLKTSELQLSLGDLLKKEAALQEALDEATEKAKGEPEPKKSRSKPKGRRDLNATDLPRVQVDLRDPSLEEAGAKVIGKEETYQLMYRPGGYAVLVFSKFKYEVPGEDGPTVRGVTAPKSLFPRGMLHPTVVARFLFQKFDQGTPFYRQERHLQDINICIDRGTMCRYAEEAGGTLGAKVVAAMWTNARDDACVLSTDATSAMIQPEPNQKKVRQACKKGHFFTVLADCDHVLFAYTEKHDQKAVKEIFRGFKGYLQADASNVYDVLDRGPPEDVEDDGTDLTMVGCWAHCRRYFFDAAVCRYPIGVQGLMQIRAMYAIDAQLKKGPPKKRLAHREEHLRPLMGSFFTWVEEARQFASGRNLATKALGYAMNQKDELLRVLEDARLPLDNTRSERSLRKVVVGRNYVEWPIMRRAEYWMASESVIRDVVTPHNQRRSRNARRLALGVQRARRCAGSISLSRARPSRWWR